MMGLTHFHLFYAVCALFVVYLLMSFGRPQGYMKVFVKETIPKRAKLNFIIILCGGNKAKGGLVLDSGIRRHIKQTAVLLKSAVLMTKRRLYFHVIADSRQLYDILVNRTFQWPSSYRERLVFSMKEVWYPEDRQDMRNMFRPCATERLFIPDIFPDMDRAIYIDTDLIFMRPPEDLWAFFDSFSPVHLAAMAPALNRIYGSAVNKVPYYGDAGLNAGLMLMNLDRMRSGGFTGDTLAIKDMYKDRIKYADQDILNILFSSFPEKMFELPCEWNYRSIICLQGANKCPSAKENGASLLHGTLNAFVNGHEMKIQSIFEGFERHRLGNDSVSELHTRLRAALTQIDRKGLKSKCKTVPGIDNILLGELEKHAVRSPKHV